MTHRRQQVLTDLALIAAFCVILFSPFVFFGLPGGMPDQEHHLRIALSIHESIPKGSLVPDISLSENKGYGSYTARLYPTLFHSVLATAKFIATTWGQALILTILFFAIVGAFGVYLLSEAHGAGRGAAIFSALAYLLFPYWINHAYNGFFYGEFAAMATLPYCFLFARRLLGEPNAPNAASLALTFAALVLSNTPQTVIGTISLAVYGMTHLTKTKAAKQIAYTVLAAIIAAFLSLGFVVRLFSEANWFKIAQHDPDPSYDFRNNFGLDFWPAELTTDSSWLATILIAIIAAVLVAALFATGRLNETFRDRSVKPLLVAFLSALFLSSPLSSVVWEAAAVLQRVQFPWRFLSILNLTAAVVIGWSFERIRRLPIESKRPRQLILFGLLAIAGTFTVKQIILAAAFEPPEEFESRMSTIGSSKTLDHWNPVWVNERAMVEPRPEIEIAGSSGFIKERSDGKILIEVTEGPAAEMRLRLIYHPYWSAFADGTSVPIVPNENGLVKMMLPERTGTVALVFSEPRSIYYSEWIGVLAIFCAGLFMLFNFHKNQRTNAYGSDRRIK